MWWLILKHEQMKHVENLLDQLCAVRILIFYVGGAMQSGHAALIMVFSFIRFIDIVWWV